MRIVLADLAGTEGFVSKDTVAGGYGSRFIPFSTTTSWYLRFKRQYTDTPSITLAYLAAVFARWGHEVVYTDRDVVDGDVAIVLSSLVDYRSETAWADAVRARGVRVGFVGLAASKMPHLFAGHADFLVDGEPEAAASRLAQGETLDGICKSHPVADLDSLPFPRWDLIRKRKPIGVKMSARPVGGGVPLLASRGCPEFCTYCPHRILASYRARSIRSVLEEVAQLRAVTKRPYVVFRDPLFSEQRERVVELCRKLIDSGLQIEFEIETRLDRLDRELLALMRRAGLRVINFGVESVSPEVLRRVGRRPIPADHQRDILDYCRQLGVVTVAFFVLGFPTDDWQSVVATIDFSVDLSPTLAQFKLLTPYPGTPLWKRLEPLVFEKDWQKFDGFTPTFTHPKLTTEQLKWLLGSAYTHFYLRPSCLANLLKVERRAVRDWVGRLDRHVSSRIARYETAAIESMTC